MEYTALTPDWWDARFERLVGFHRVMNSGYPLAECLDETTRQVEFLKSLPLNWTRVDKSSGKIVYTSKSDLTLLDVGCGFGRLTRLFKSVPVGEGEASPVDGLAMDAVGLDWSEKMCRSAKANYPYIEFVRGDIADDGVLAGRKFDVVFEWSVLCHLVTPLHFTAAVASMKRLATLYVVCVDLVDPVDGVEFAPHVRAWGLDRYVQEFAGLELVFNEVYEVAGQNGQVFDRLRALVFRTDRARREEVERSAAEMRLSSKNSDGERRVKAPRLDTVSTPIGEGENEKS